MTLKNELPAGARLESVRCPLCDSFKYRNLNKSKDYLLTGEEFTVAQCLDCSLIFTNPRVKEEYISQYYFSEYSPYKPSRKPKYFPEVKNWISRRFGNVHWEILRTLNNLGARSALEIGPGSGSLLMFLKQYGFEVAGVELNQDCVDQIREENVTCYNGRLENVHQELDQFDAVILSHVFEHLYSPKKILKIIRNILPEKGIIFISVPDIGSVEAKIFGRFWIGLDVPRHVIHYDKNTISALLSENGFRVIKIENPIFSSSFIESLGRKLYKNGRLPNKVYYPLYYIWKILSPLHYKIIGSGVINVTAMKKSER